MAIRLNLTELNKLFNQPSANPPPPKVQTLEDQVWLEQFFARVHFIESLNAKQRAAIELSPSSSIATLVDEDDGFVDIFNVSKVEEPFSITDVQGDLRMCSIMNEPSSHFLENLYGGTEHRKALSMNTDLPSYRSTPSPSSSISSTSFNPHADPFVPAFTLPVHAITPTPSSEHIPWFPIFWAGVTADSNEAHHIHAIALVDSIEWTIESLAVLSQHFCWKGADDISQSGSGVSTFVRIVHDQLRDVYGDWYANCLTRHIRECVVGHFKACWKSDQPQSITFANPPSVPYLTSAFNLTTFIGELFSQGLLPRSTVHHCLSILVSELNAIEHMHAIHLLLLHANARLWRGKDANKAIRDFVSSFAQRASCLGEDASVVGNQFEKSEIRAWAKEITDMINKWQVPRRTFQNDAKVYNAGDKVLSFGLQIGQRR